MKGLLVGVFFAIKGLFQFISAVAVVPFAIPSIWNSITSVPNCGFGYYVFIIVIGLIGLVVFSIVVKRYKYRQRDERPLNLIHALLSSITNAILELHKILQLVCVALAMRMGIQP